MDIQSQLMADLKAAMQSGDTSTRDTLRMIRAAIKQVEVDGGKELDHDGAMAVVTKQAKQRRESLAEYEKAGREDLAEKERSELAVIDKYLPKMMSREEVVAVVQPIVDEMGVTEMQGMGKVMGRVMPLLKGKADGGVVNGVVKELIQANQ